MNKIGPFKFGSANAELLPHYLPDIGPRMIMHVDGHGTHLVENITEADVRQLIMQLTIAADMLAALERRARRHDLHSAQQTNEKET